MPTPSLVENLEHQWEEPVVGQVILDLSRHVSLLIVDSCSMHCHNLDDVLNAEAPHLLTQVAEHWILPAHVIDIGNCCGVVSLYQH